MDERSKWETRIHQNPRGDERVNQEIKEVLKTFMETNENEDTTIQNLCDIAKAVPRGKYITIQASIQKLETTQTQKLTLHIKELKKKTANRCYTQHKKRINNDSSRTQ